MLKIVINDTFIISYVEMLLSKLVFFLAYHIIDNFAIHIGGRPKIHIMIVTVLPLTAGGQAHGINLQWGYSVLVLECVAFY